MEGPQGARQGGPDPGHARALRPLRRCARARQGEQRARMGPRRPGPDGGHVRHPAGRTRAAVRQGRHHPALRPERPEDHRRPCRTLVRARLEGRRRQGHRAARRRARGLHHRDGERLQDLAHGRYRRLRRHAPDRGDVPPGRRADADRQPLRDEPAGRRDGRARHDQAALRDPDPLRHHAATARHAGGTALRHGRRRGPAHPGAATRPEVRVLMPTRRGFCAASATLLAGCASFSGASSGAARAELGTTGKLRAAINFGNPILANRGAGGEATGVSVDLAREAARRLELPIELVTFTSAGNTVDAVKAGRVDLAFVAIDPVRAAGMEYTAPYVIIEGAYLVRDASPLRRNEDVDRDGTRVAVGRGSAYDLFLTRELKNASLVRVSTSPQVVDDFLAQNLDITAG